MVMQMSREKLFKSKEYEEFIKTLPEEDQQAADQINRRTEFSVLSLTYNMK